MKKLLYVFLLSLLIWSCKKSKKECDGKDSILEWNSPLNGDTLHFGDTLVVNGYYCIRQMGDWEGTDYLTLNVTNFSSRDIGYDGYDGNFNEIYTNSVLDTSEVTVNIHLPGGYGVETINQNRKVIFLPN